MFWVIFWSVLAVGGLGWVLWPQLILIPAWLAALSFAWIFTIFAFGTFWFWVLVLALCALEFWAVEMASWADGYTSCDSAGCDYEGNLLAFWTLIGFFLLLQFFGDIKVFSYLFSEPVKFIGILVGYFVAGALWSLFKFDRYVSKTLRPEYDSRRERFLERKNIKDDLIPDNLKDEWRESLPKYLKNLEAKYHKNRILCWMIGWPWSFVWSIIRDLVKEIFEFIYEWLSTVYQKILERHFASVAPDFKKAEVRTKSTD